MQRRKVTNTNIDLILLALAATLRLAEAHYRTLFGQRKTGSKWGASVPRGPDWFLKRFWVEVPAVDLPTGAALPICRYFRTVDMDVLDGALESVAVLNELPEHLQKLVQLVKSPHGYDLVMPAGTALPQKPACEAWLVLGPAGKNDETLIVWTAFPGRLAGGFDPDVTGFDGRIESVDFTRPYAVKVLAK
jgi:hypothetical protein